jgi:hypothetical protein
MAYDDAGLPGLRAARGFAVCVASGASAVAEFQDVLERLQGRPMRRRDASTVVESIGHTLTNYAAVDLDLQGQAMTLGSGCASGVDAIQWVCALSHPGRPIQTIPPRSSDQGRPQRGHSSTPSPTLRAAEPGAAAPPRAD